MGGISDGDIDGKSFRKSGDIMNRLRALGLRSSAEAPAAWFCVNGTKEGPFLVEAYTDEAGTKNIPGALVAMSIINSPGDVTVARRTGDPQDPQGWQISILPEKFNDDALNRWVSSAPAPRVNGSAAKGNAAPEIGEWMEDDTILAGYYEGKPLYTTARDAAGTCTFNEAAEYAKALDANGHHDFRVPSQGELNVLFENRNKGRLKGSFNQTGGDRAWHWSSSQKNDDSAWAQCFSDGRAWLIDKDHTPSLRCVRG